MQKEYNIPHIKLMLRGKADLEYTAAGPIGQNGDLCMVPCQYLFAHGKPQSAPSNCSASGLVYPKEGVEYRIAAGFRDAFALVGDPYSDGIEIFLDCHGDLCLRWARFDRVFQ